MNTSKILIVDDEPNICFILERALRRDDYAIESVHSGAEALERLQRSTYDLLLLDLNMHPLNGLQVLSALRQKGQDAVVIILTAHSTIESAVEALRMGAFDYLFKPATPDAIRQRVQAGLAHRQLALHRQRLLSQMEQIKQTLSQLDAEQGAQAELASPDRFLRSGCLVIDRNHRTATLNGRLLELTTTEFNLLLCLAQSAPQPVSPRQLLQAALNYDSADSEARELIKWHIYHLRQKVESDSGKPQLIKTVRYKGYLWSG